MDSSLRVKYRDSTHKFCRALNADQTAFEERLISSNNLSAFYRYVSKRISNNNTSIGTIINRDGKTITDNTLKAKAFNCQFASVGVADNDITPDCANVTLCSTLDNVVTDEFEVMKSIDKLKSNCSSGPDGFPPIMFKQLKFCLSPPLAHVFNQLLS